MLRAVLLAFVSLVFWASAGAQAQTAAPALQFDRAKGLLNTYCSGCHAGDWAIGGFNLDQATDEASLLARPQRWSSAARRIRDMEMPPRGQPAPSPDERDALADWIEGTLRAGVCAVGLDPGPQPLRRLNRNEYAATIRDLLSVHFNAGATLPNDGAGGEGFDNAAETLFLSPMHAEKYLEAARQSLDYALADPRSRDDFLIEPGEDLTAEAAAKATLDKFLPRAFRRPVSEAEVRRYQDLFDQASGDGVPYDQAISFALQGVLAFMFGNSVSNQNFSFLDGVERAHHSISHHQNDPDQLRQYQLINRWHIGQYAYLLERLSQMKEGESTLLDNSMILFARDCATATRTIPTTCHWCLAAAAKAA